MTSPRFGPCWRAAVSSSLVCALATSVRGTTPTYFRSISWSLACSCQFDQSFCPYIADEKVRVCRRVPVLLPWIRASAFEAFRHYLPAVIVLSTPTSKNGAYANARNELSSCTNMTSQRSRFPSSSRCLGIPRRCFRIRSRTDTLAPHPSAPNAECCMRACAEQKNRNSM